MIYSYPELKGKIKVGDKVRAAQEYFNPCAQLVSDGSNKQEITRITDDRFWINHCPHLFSASSASLEIIEPNQPTMNNEREEITWENLRAGDKVVNDSYGHEHTILNIITGLYFVSFGGSENGGASFFTLAGLKEDFTIVQPDKIKQPRKVTLAEIAEKFGEEVEVVEE